MIIKGLERLTLLDYPDKIACTIFTFGCNFRCGFCHNPELVLEDGMPEIKKEDIIRFLKERKGLLDAVCITGGEPTINKDLPDFIAEIKSLGYFVKLDTNGSNPDMLKILLERNLLDYIAMDIKGIPEMYDGITCVKVDIGKIEESIDIIKNGVENYEFRITVVPGIFKDEHADIIGKWLGNIRAFYIQNFRNEKSLDEKFKNVEPFKKVDMERFKQLFGKYFKLCETRDEF